MIESKFKFRKETEFLSRNAYLLYISMFLSWLPTPARTESSSFIGFPEITS